jgi:hypothetical protein
MRERKPVKPGTAEPRLERAGRAEEGSLRPEATKNMDVAKKARGRLSREDQRRLGDILHRVYDEVVKEGVPPRFDKLLRQLVDTRDNAARRRQGIEETSDLSCSPEPDGAVRAKGAKPQDEGSS